MKRYTVLLMLFCLGCKHQQPATPIHISLINGNQSLKIAGIDPVIMHDINRDTVSAWQSLFAIYRMPADTDMKDYQPIQPGKYQLLDSVLVFTPDTPFTKQRTYFMRYYNYAGNKNIWDYVKGNTHIGKLHFTDLIFRGGQKHWNNANLGTSTPAYRPALHTRARADFVKAVCKMH